MLKKTNEYILEIGNKNDYTMIRQVPTYIIQT